MLIASQWLEPVLRALVLIADPALQNVQSRNAELRTECGANKIVSMTTIYAFKSLAASMVGLPITHVSRSYESALFIDIGELHPVAKCDGSHGNPEGQVSLGVEWSWRIENQTAIRCGSLSEEELWEQAFDTLRDGRIAGCKLSGTLPEEIITTDGGIRFLSFSTTGGQPQWHFADRRDSPPRRLSVREGRLHLGDGSEPFT